MGKLVRSFLWKITITFAFLLQRFYVNESWDLRRILLHELNMMSTTKMVVLFQAILILNVVSWLFIFFPLEEEKVSSVVIFVVFGIFHGACTISVSILFTYRALWVLQSPRDRIMVIFVQQHHSPVDVYNGKHSNFSVLQKLENTLRFRDI